MPTEEQGQGSPDCPNDWKREMKSIITKQKRITYALEFTISLVIFFLGATILLISI